MRRRLAVVAARTARAVRGLWLDRNPLRRTTDRVEAALLGGLAVALLAGTPVLAVAVANNTYRAAVRAAYAQRAWHQVHAVLTGAPTTVDGGYTWDAPAAWDGPGRARHTGLVTALPGTLIGGAVTVWVSADGRMTGPPVRLWQASGRAALNAVFTGVGAAIFLLCVGFAAHTLIDRRRLASWEADWRATQPHWTHRH